MRLLPYELKTKDQRPRTHETLSTFIIRGIIFDLDGTLVDTYPAILHSINFVLSAFGRDPVSLQTVKKMVGRGMENLILQAVGKENLREGIRIFRERYEETHLRGNRLLPGVQETLQELEARNIKMAVASNKPSDFSKGILRHLNIENFFLDCYGPDRGVAPKPDPSMLRKLMNHMEVEAGETLYVGDMVLDVESARLAGVSVALIPTGGNSKDELAAAGADYVLEAFPDILPLVHCFAR